MKIYADLVGNHKKQRIKSLCDNNILTGEYALKGNGRKGGWFYEDEEGNGHFTHGKKPSRAFHKAYTSLKSKIINRIQNSLKGL